MATVYGYARISRREQKLERQIKNIEAAYPSAIIFREAYTGTKVEGRKQLDKLLKVAKAGDTIVFDEVSRMSRNAAEGYELYERLYNDGIELVFLKQHYIDTATYKQALTNGIPLTGTNVDCILKGVNEYLLTLAKEQIRLAFEQAQAEVDHLHQRTKEGIREAKAKGKRIGNEKGCKLTVKKEAPAKLAIKKYSKHFDGNLKDYEVMQLAHISRPTFYKYLKEMLAEAEASPAD